MKKKIALVLAALMLASLASCAKKPAAPDTTTEEVTDLETQETQAEVTGEATEAEETEAEIEGDPVEYGREYWEEKYPGENICPFSIDIDGTEYSYYWVSGFEGYDGTIVSWLSQPFNWNGWHKTEDGKIVNQDETVMISESWANGDESLSSFCTITTETYEKPEA